MCDTQITLPNQVYQVLSFILPQYHKMNTKYKQSMYYNKLDNYGGKWLKDQ